MIEKEMGNRGTKSEVKKLLASPLRTTLQGCAEGRARPAFVKAQRVDGR